MTSAENFLQNKLAERRQAGSYRTLKPENSLIDFCSNDYLGFSRSAVLKNNIATEIELYRNLNGSTGSRLISGNLEYTEKLEHELAGYFKAEAGLLFNSGYDANLGLLSSIPQRGDTIITDELIHASLIDGARLSHANRYTFRHNDLQSLEAKLRHAKGNCYVVVESVYSMDGDTPPLTDMLALVEQYDANLIVDEAHAVGLYDTGIVTQLHLEQRVFARIVTFGKALGCHGAIVLGSDALRKYLVNFARSFIYTTASPFHQLAAIRCAIDLLQHSKSEIATLQHRIQLFKQTVETSTRLLASESSIQCILLNSNDFTRKTAAVLQDNGFDIRPILSPTVQQGSERIRICLHTFNSAEQVQSLAININQLLND